MVVWILISGLIIVVLFSLIVGLLYNRSVKKKLERGEISEEPSIQLVDTECCGQHEVCEKESLLAAVSKQIEYYDDEELDRYIGIPSDAYTNEQIEEFRIILYTMMEIDVAGWVRSLQLRNIALPDELKDEVFLIVGERRMTGKTKQTNR